MNETIYSIDVEPDLHSGGNLGITMGLRKFEKLCDRHKIKPVLFVVSSIVPKNKRLLKRLLKKGWDISFHGYSHKRFDDLSYAEKEMEIKKSVSIFKKHLGIMPKGFRAPQHSIDDETLNLLEKHGIKYDSSYYPLNFLQLFFFPKRAGKWIKIFFSRLNEYKIRSDLIERPASSLIIPFVSLTIRVFPKWLLYFYVKAVNLFYKKPVFYAHSWDFIELKDSKIDRAFPSDKFINKLYYIMSI